MELCVELHIVVTVDDEDKARTEIEDMAINVARELLHQHLEDYLEAAEVAELTEEKGELYH